MQTLKFPLEARIQLCQVGHGGDWTPCPVAGAVLDVRVFARYKNDYQLGPFFSDASGLLTLRREVLQAFAAATLESGIMDYQRVEEAFPLVEMRLRTDPEIAAEIEARRSWGLMAAEAPLWGTVDELVRQLRAAPNARLRTVPNAGFGIVRDLWDGSEPSPNYRLLVAPQRAA